MSAEKQRLQSELSYRPQCARTNEFVKAGCGSQGLKKAFNRGEKYEGEGIVTSIGC